MRSNQNLKGLEGQISAMQFAKRISKKIIKDFPEVAESYMQGKLYREVIEEYDLENHYGLTFGVARRALEFALHELIDRDDIERLSKEKRIL